MNRIGGIFAILCALSSSASCQQVPRSPHALAKEYAELELPLTATVVEFVDGYIHQGEVMPEGHFRSKFLLPDSTYSRVETFVRGQQAFDVQSSDSLARMVREILPKEQVGLATMTFGRTSQNFQVLLVNPKEKTLVMVRAQISAEF